MTNSTNTGAHPLTFSPRRLGLIGSVAFFALFVFLWSVAPAQANLRAVGPTHPDPSVAPYPFWYEDVNGVRLQLCVHDGDAVAGGVPAFCGNPAADLNAPNPADANNGGEGFWWMAVAASDFPGNEGLANADLPFILYEAAIEASTFAPVETGASVFSRLRVRIDNTVTCPDVDGDGLPGCTYVLVHPFGTNTYTNVGTAAARDINDTIDFGCLDQVAPASCFDGVAPEFDAVLSDPGPNPTTQPIDTFLKWDPAVNPQAPPGFLGDGGLGLGTPHKVIGSPVNDPVTGLPQNYVKVYRLNALGERVLITQTDLFQIEGWLTAGPTQPDLTAASDSGASQVDNITNVQTPTFTGSAGAGNQVNVYDGATLIGSTFAASPSGLYSFTVPVAGALAGGSHAISATEQTNPLDPLTESEHSASLNMIVDVTAPAAPALAPDLLAASDTGSSSTDNITNDTTPTFTGGAGNVEANATVSILVDGVSRGSAAASAAGSYSITTSALTGGVKSITATATDVAGNVGAAPANALQVTIDTVAPAVPSGPDLPAGADSGLSSSDNVTNQSSLTLVGSAEAGAAVKVMVDGVLLSTVAVGGDGSYAVNLAGLAEGAHQVAALALDAAGNESGPSGALGILIDSTAPTAPGLAALSPFSLSRSINLEWSASSEGGSGLAGYSLSYQRAAVRGPAGASIEWANGLAATSAVFSGVPGSSYCFTVGATDKAGNSSAASSQRCTAVPLDDRALAARGGGWARKLGPGHFLGTYTMGAKKGAQVVLNGIQAKRLGVLVTTCPGCGSLKAYWNGVLVKTIDLDTRAVHKKRLVSLRSFPAVRTGNLSLRIVSPTGERVIIDGVAASRM